MTETVQDVLQKMSEDAGITGPIRFNPKGLMTQGQFMDFVKDYTERFAQALTAEKGSKSTPLTEKQKNCPY
ncbi:hypothetical protein, partial [Schleiferilactobacillus perolens]|uniref:hypothetical protein n=1 Tax=Schleiferilactobacillus perolens TaxID=100468 RepID=UPI0039E86B0A